MARQQKDPLRTLEEEEKTHLKQISRAHSAAAEEVIRAKILLAVAAGQTYVEAARSVGRRDGDAVSRVVSRFNEEGMAALSPRHGGGPAATYGQAERQRILIEFERVPDREQDGTAIWSLSTLQRALRQAPDGLPDVSTYTIWGVLRAAGWSWQKDRTWCQTGTVLRKRKGELVEVTDPDGEAKKT